MMEVCLAKSSAFLIGAVILVIVRKAARLAVYEEMRIRVKNHQTPAIILVELAFGASSQPVKEDYTVLNNLASLST